MSVAPERLTSPIFHATLAFAVHLAEKKHRVPFLLIPYGNAEIRTRKPEYHQQKSKDFHPPPIVVITPRLKQAGVFLCLKGVDNTPVSVLHFVLLMLRLSQIAYPPVVLILLASAGILVALTHSTRPEITNG